MIAVLGSLGAISGVSTRPDSTATLNTSHALEDGLILAWLLNEGTGEPSDYTSSNYDGTIRSGSTSVDWTDTNDPSAGITCPSGDTYASNGVWALDWGNDEIQGSSDRTIVIRIKISGSNTSYQFFNYGDDGGSSGRFSLATYASGLCVETTSANYKYGDTDITTDEWVTVAVVCDSVSDIDDIDLYVDGVLETSTTVAGGAHTVNTDTGTATDTDLSIGDAYNHNTGLEGEIEFLYVYNKALTAAQVASISKDPYQIF